MARYEVIILPHVQEQVEEIWAYQYAIDPKRALRFIDAWEDCIEHLELNPTHARHKGK